MLDVASEEYASPGQVIGLSVNNSYGLVHIIQEKVGELWRPGVKALQ